MLIMKSIYNTQTSVDLRKQVVVQSVVYLLILDFIYPLDQSDHTSSHGKSEQTI